MNKDEIKEILDNFKIYEDRYRKFNETQFIIFYRDIHLLLDYITKLQQENKQLKEEVETILDFDYFKNECPLNIGFGDELENKAQDVFYEDEYCENCKDDYKTCWLKYFKKLQELKEKYK